MVENRQRCRELIGDLLPPLDELANEDGPVAEKLRNVMGQVRERTPSCSQTTSPRQRVP